MPETIEALLAKLHRQIVGDLATAHGATAEHRKRILRAYVESVDGGVRELFRFVMTGYGRIIHPLEQALSPAAHQKPPAESCKSFYSI
jgi:hypothetical protein